MLLTIDIGNTTISIGLFKDDELVGEWRLATDRNRTPDELGLQIKGLIDGAKIDARKINDVIISSVVPYLNQKLIRAFEKHFQRSPQFLDFRCGLIKLAVDDPMAVGADRIADSIAGYHLYGGPILIIDFGTATVFNLISAKGEFLGGAIAPEMELTAEMLFERTALLPQVELEIPSSVIGKNTVDNIKAGVVLGFIDMVSGLITRFKREYAKDLKVIATGGRGELFYKQIKAIEEYDPFLTLKGLHIAWQMQRA